MRGDQLNFSLDLGIFKYKTGHSTDDHFCSYTDECNHIIGKFYLGMQIHNHL